MIGVIFRWHCFAEAKPPIATVLTQPEPDVDLTTAEIRLRDVNSAEANALQKPYSISCTDLQIVSHYFSSKD